VGDLVEQFPGVGESLTASGFQTNFHQAGRGNAVILLHGSGAGVSAWTNWRRVLPALADSFRVLAPDLPGFGFSERRPGQRYDMKLWVEHLIGFLDAAGVERTHLVGNSFGGSLALAAAVRFPARFDRLVLMGTPCGKFAMTPGLRAGWDYQPSRESMRAILQLFPYDTRYVTDELVEERYATSLIPGAQEGLRSLLAKPNDEGETILSGMPEEMVAKLEHPTLILHGREDHVVPLELGLRLARAIPNAELHVFGRCGHWVQAERFAQFIALTRAHLQAPA
jgi:2-hydroxy-6-oxo-octa-2,4-dienoate hydrolase